MDSRIVGANLVFARESSRALAGEHQVRPYERVVSRQICQCRP